MGGLCCHPSTPSAAAEGEGGYVHVHRQGKGEVQSGVRGHRQAQAKADDPGYYLADGHDGNPFQFQFQGRVQGHRQDRSRAQEEYNLSGPLKPPEEESMPLPPNSRSLIPRGGSVDEEDFSFETQDNELFSNPSSSHSPLKAIANGVAEMWRMHHGSVDMDLNEDLEEGSEKGGRTKLSRVLSNRVKSARSRTTLVAKKGAAKMNEVGALLGRAGTVGLGKAVEALDTLGSSMTNINFGSGFASGVSPKGNKIGILAFEVANTIVKGFNLKLSLSDESMKILKEEILRSEGVQLLVSRDTGELLKIAADDKRNELKLFSGEVVRFGNHCRDPQWHQLDRVFEKLGTEVSIPKQSKEEAEAEMQNLIDLAQHTAELYHELHALDRLEIDYRRKLQEEEMSNSSQRGENLAILRSELKSQKKHVRNLKKKSLWSKILEEVMEKLVDIVYFLHQEIESTFIDAGTVSSYSKQERSVIGKSQRLGPAGLSLHYANIINQIDNLVSRPNSVPPNTRDNLYQGLPPHVKSALRTEIHNLSSEELTIPQIKEEMERTLAWLVPVAANTTKAHHGFGWVGEWANMGSSLDRRMPGHMELTLLQTLHHADQKATDQHILELILLLHRLVSLVQGQVPGAKSPIRSPVRQIKLSLKNGKPSFVRENGNAVMNPQLSPEDQAMLQRVKTKKITPGISKSQEFNSSKVNRTKRLCKSNSHSPSTSTEANFQPPRRHHVVLAPFNFEADRNKAMDVIDRVDNI